jgi:hypothetical protein
MYHRLQVDHLMGKVNLKINLLSLKNQYLEEVNLIEVEDDI